MKKKTGYAVFTKTDSSLDFMIRGNFGNDEDTTQGWADRHIDDQKVENKNGMTEYLSKYPKGLFVKKIKY